MTHPHLRTLASVGALLALACAIAPAGLAADTAIIATARDIKWGPAPPGLPKGAMLAVLAGDPGGTGPVSVRLKFPAGYVIAPHWHPTDEQVTVLTGSLALGMGDTLDKKTSTTLRPGGFAVAPAKMHHYAWTSTGATIQVNLMGPFQITYVNAADDPSKPH